jgi:nucleoside-diphosphate-sugar epimerase
MEARMRKILVTGALGQIGAELVPALSARYGAEAVVASDLRMRTRAPELEAGAFEHLDCTDIPAIHNLVQRHDIGAIYHLASLLSAVAEEKPQAAWNLNMGGLYGILEAAREHRCQVFAPSSIGAFGPSTPPDLTPQVTIQRPNTIYGVTKVAGELLCDYYHSRFGVDTRGLRLPGLISHITPPGGGTTDYAVEIFRQAVRYRHYSCFLEADTRLDMMYMPDAIAGMIELMAADPDRLADRNAFNVTAMNFTPDELAAEIRIHIPDFVIEYDDVDPARQAIAYSWPRRVDDAAARQQWDWAPRFDLAHMTIDMLEKVRKRGHGA